MTRTSNHPLLAALLISGCAAVPVLSAQVLEMAPTTTTATLGTQFTYQGRLLDAGAPATGSFDLQFTLYDAATTPPGAAVGVPVVKGSVPVTDGLFTVELDFGTSPFGGDARWVELAVRPGGSSDAFTVLSPRQPIDATPYAVFAARAGDLVCVGCAGATDLADGAVTVTKLAAGSGSNGQVLTLTGGGTSLAWQTPPGGLTGSGTASRLATWSGTTTLASSGLTWDTANSRLGIGTTTPNEQLEITGNLRLPGTTSVTGQIKMGSNLFAHKFGAFNTFVGENAGNLTMTGFGNSGFGITSLAANTRGNGNTAVGAYSLTANRSAAENTAVGAWSLYTQSFPNSDTLYPSDNTAVGFEALYSNQPTSTANGIKNTAVGAGAMRANTTGVQNVATGATSLNANTVGVDNTAIGFASLHANTNASRNTAVGSQALYTQAYSNTGTTWNSENTAVGYSALYANAPNNPTGGILNTAIGSQALLSNNIGSRNTAGGASSLRANTSGLDNTGAGANTLYGNTLGSDNVAIGSSSLTGNSTANKSTAVGSHALASMSYDAGGSAWDAEDTAVGYNALGLTQAASIQTGMQNAALGARAGATNQSGAKNTFVGALADAAASDLTNATAVGFGAVVDASYKVRIGNADVTVIEGQVPFTSASDARLKDDIRDLSMGLDLIDRLRPVAYTMKGGNGRTDLGFIAQDVEALLGSDYNVVTVGSGPERRLGLRYTDLIAPLVKAVQEQQAVIQSQQQRIDSLEARLAALETAATARR